jgi:hypothetical protein
MRGRFIPLLLVLLIACGEPPTPAPATPPQPITPQPITPQPEPSLPIPEPEPPELVLPTYALSELMWTSASNALGPFEKDAANGTAHGGDGSPLTINGKIYPKGLGTAAPSEIVFNLGGACSSFSAEVGVDDSADATGATVTFEIYVDTLKLWDSGFMTVGDDFKLTGQLDVTDKQTLKLVITGAPGGSQHNLADWAAPTLACASAPTALAPSDASGKGVFGLATDWPTIPTHAALLPNSTLLSWYSRDTDGNTRLRDYNDQDLHSFTLVDLWDINTNSHTRTDNTKTDLFCSGFTLTSEGSLYVAGGNLGSNEAGFYPGSRHTNIFDFTARGWSQGPDMTEGRWYPSVVSLPNKELLIMGGDSNEDSIHNFIPDVWDPATNTLRRLTNASSEDRDLHPFYPWLHVAPNGQVFNSGSSPQMAYLSTSGNGRWSRSYTRDALYRGYGSSVMYEPGKILVMGGGGNTRSTVTIDLTDGVQVEATGSMRRGRTNLNATLLPDGTVFVNGGNTSGINFDDDTSVYSSEIWDPATGEWQLTAPAQKPRNYHAVSLLLPDGRVLTGGGGGCGSCGVNHQNVEIYFPPYLFKDDDSGLLAERPTITEAPENISYDESVTLTTPSASTITKVALIAFGSVTHAFNTNQRYVPLEMSDKTNTTLTLTSPENANLAPPGYYMLFIIDENGVPSVARTLQLE